MKRPFIETMSKEQSNGPAKKAKVEKIPCTLCGKLCKNKRGLSMHMTSSHGCGHCDGTFKDLEEHTENVHRTEQCAECSRKFTSTAEIKRHMSQAHLVECDICLAQFFNPSNMTEHRQEEHEEECDMCQQRFLKTAGLLEEHLDTVHGIKPRLVRQFAGGMFMMVSQ